MKTYKSWARVAAIVAVAVGLGHPAAAATRTTSFGVSATVVATCAISPAPRAGSGLFALTCQPPKGAAPAVVAPPPLVRVARDPKSGALVQTIEF